MQKFYSANSLWTVLLGKRVNVYYYTDADTDTDLKAHLLHNDLQCVKIQFDSYALFRCDKYMKLWITQNFKTIDVIWYNQTVFEKGNLSCYHASHYWAFTIHTFILGVTRILVAPFFIGPILNDRLKVKILKPWKGALSSHSVCLSVNTIQDTLFGLGT